jgi:hypothetical protein
MNVFQPKLAVSGDAVTSTVKMGVGSVGFVTPRPCPRLTGLAVHRSISCHDGSMSCLQVGQLCLGMEMEKEMEMPSGEPQDVSYTSRRSIFRCR